MTKPRRLQETLSEAVSTYDRLIVKLFEPIWNVIKEVVSSSCFWLLLCWLVAVVRLLQLSS